MGTARLPSSESGWWKRGRERGEGKKKEEGTRRRRGERKGEIGSELAIMVFYNFF